MGWSSGDGEMWSHSPYYWKGELVRFLGRMQEVKMRKIRDVTDTSSLSNQKGGVTAPEMCSQMSFEY